MEDEGGQVAEGGLGEVQLVEERVRQQGYRGITDNHCVVNLYSRNCPRTPSTLSRTHLLLCN